MKLQIRNIFTVLCILSSVFSFYSCKKDKPVYSDVPEISFQSISSTSVNASDPLTFTIAYTDGNGDLGENVDGVHNLFLTDSRFGTAYEYRIRELSPSTSIIIKGTLTIELLSAKKTGAGTENAVFSIYVVDRAGNSSNTVTSPTVTVH